MTEKTSKGNDLQRGERLQVMLDQHELAALDTFRYDNRIPSRAAAVRELLRRGLAAVGYANVSGVPGSSNYGVINSPPTTEDEDKA
jgi:metal-responsive CopG/Arc/MetJ family transcriptional regulator